MSTTAHPLPFTQNNKLERTYTLPFAIFRQGALTHIGAWLLRELGDDDDIHVEATGDSQLHVSMPATELTCSCESLRNRTFAEVDRMLEVACRREEDHQDSLARHIDLL
ncbi:MAG: hypothetical protein KGS72_04815 [Cyanobacteria bacterium REEB67]|nr:hypothetical protein [Cyanobacteria bacterium REEB67]